MEVLASDVVIGTEGSVDPSKSKENGKLSLDTMICVPSTASPGQPPTWLLKPWRAACGYRLELNRLTSPDVMFNTTPKLEFRGSRDRGDRGQPLGSRF